LCKVLLVERERERENRLQSNIEKSKNANKKEPLNKIKSNLWFSESCQMQQQQQQHESGIGDYYFLCTTTRTSTTITVGVCDHSSTGLHGSSSSSYSYSYSFAIIRNAAGRWMKAAGFLHSFLPEIHVTCHKLGSNPGKNQNTKTKNNPSHLSSN
jgi:hypothetical protein